ncbi:MbcA/ParS/Xre antitoxin family protein [Salinisphaera hydrothermalis]|uniref:MbcA/ParS/Xre antitoxin family protein n=1 Tax=Salinisphaera hydrothermalis TaxID=563188 RepID=UPI003342ABCB
MTTTAHHADHGRLFDRFVESIRDEGTSLVSPKKFADAFHIPIEDLAAEVRVHRNTVNSHPESPRIQRFMREALKVLSASNETQGDIGKKMYWMRNYPIPAFGHKTAWDLTLEGRADAVVAYLESIADGFAG